MYSRSKRMKTIKLYIKYDHSVADVIHELGYPDRKTLAGWYGIYLIELESGGLVGSVFTIPEIFIRTEGCCRRALS